MQLHMTRIRTMQLHMTGTEANGEVGANKLRVG